MHNIRFGDIIVIHVYDQNVFKGYLSCKPGRPRDFVATAYKHDKVLRFCVTPFGFFAEDKHRNKQHVGREPFVLQQLTTNPGYSECGKRNKLVANDGKLCLLETDIYNQTDKDTMIILEKSCNNRLLMKVGWGYVHDGDGLFMDLKGHSNGALNFEFQAVDSLDPVRFGKGQVFRPYFKPQVSSHFDPLSPCQFN